MNKIFFKFLPVFLIAFFTIILSPQTLLAQYKDLTWPAIQTQFSDITYLPTEQSIFGDWIGTALIQSPEFNWSILGTNRAASSPIPNQYCSWASKEGILVAGKNFILNFNKILVSNSFFSDEQEEIFKFRYSLIDTSENDLNLDTVSAKFLIPLQTLSSDIILPTVTSAFYEFNCKLHKRNSNNMICSITPTTKPLQSWAEVNKDGSEWMMNFYNTFVDYAKKQKHIAYMVFRYKTDIESSKILQGQ